MAHHSSASQSQQHPQINTKNDALSGRRTDRLIGRKVDEHRGRQIGRKIDKQINRQTQTNKQIGSRLMYSGS
jgi:hypothetical protein